MMKLLALLLLRRQPEVPAPALHPDMLLQHLSQMLPLSLLSQQLQPVTPLLELTVSLWQECS